MAQTYTHDSQLITLQNCVDNSLQEKNIRLPEGSWQEKLDKIKKKVKQKFNIDNDIKWIMSINNNCINPSNLKQFQQVLSKTPPPINIKILKVNS